MQQTKRVLRGAASVLWILFWVVVLVFVLAYAYGLRPYIVESGSMEPFLPVGSVCVVNRRADFQDIAPGDIVAFRRGGRVKVIHRVLAVTEQGLETKGDANFVSDGVSTTIGNYEGKYLFHIPELGKFIRWTQTSRGFVMCLAGLLVVGVLYFGFGQEKR